MTPNADRTPKWIVYLGGFASLATIISVIIAYVAYVHPMQGTANPPPATPISVVNSNMPDSGGNSNTSGSGGNSNTSSNGGNSNTPVSQGSSQVDVQGAQSTIEAFCQLLNSSAIQQAYNLTSMNYQGQHDINQFTSQFNNMDLINGGCVYNHPKVSGNNVEVALTANRIDTTNGTTSSTSYMVVLVKDSQSGSWAIDSIQ